MIRGFPARIIGSGRSLLLAGCVLGYGLALGLSPALAAQMEDFPVVKLQSLEKVTARTETFEARVGSTVKFGPLFIKVHACRKSSPLDKPESAAFLQIWEIDEHKEAQWVFSGWMFASSPALSPMDHPTYDVWVLDCLSGQAEEKKSDELPSEDIPSQPSANSGDVLQEGGAPQPAQAAQPQIGPALNTPPIVPAQEEAPAPDDGVRQEEIYDDFGAGSEEIVVEPLD